MGVQEKIKRRPHKGGGGGSNDFDGLVLEEMEIPDIGEVLAKLDNDIQTVGGLINATQERIDRKLGRRNRSCEC